MNYQPLQTFLSLPEKKRQRFVESSLLEFATHSYKGASLCKIIRKSNISKGSFYQYFKNKKHLYLYLVQNSIETKIRKLSEKAVNGQDLFTFLKSIKQEKFVSNPDQVAFMLKVSNDHSMKEVQEIIKNTSDAFFLNLIKKNKLYLDPNLNPEVITFVLTTLFNYFGKFHLSLKSSKERDTAYRSLITILEKGLGR